MSEERRRAMLAHVVASGRVAALAPFAAELARYALLVVGADAIASLAARPDAASAIVRGHLGRVRVEGDVIDLALVPRAWAEGSLGELNGASASRVGFGEVRVVVLDGDGFSFGSLPIAPGSSGVLA